MDSSPPVAVEGLLVRRGGSVVLPGIDLEVPDGLITGILGPSGSGKSTLLRAVAGVQKTAAGSVTVLGRPAGSAALRRLVGYATQAPAVYLDLTLTENLRYFAAVRGDSASDVPRVLDLVGLTRHATRLAGRLSGGELARASLAVALLGQSRLLILDEPTAGLDPVLRARLWELFAELAGQGVTIMISSHVMDEAARCDRLLLMRSGRILAQGSPASLLERTGAADVEGAFIDLIEQGAGDEETS